MKIDISRHPHDRDPLFIFVNGRLAAQVSTCFEPPSVQGRDALEAEVYAARTAHRLAHIGVPNMYRNACRFQGDDWARGVRDGLLGVREPYPGTLPLPSRRPDGSVGYMAGYDDGEYLRNICMSLTEEESAP